MELNDCGLEGVASTREMAVFFGVTRKTICLWVEDGMPKIGFGMFDFEVCKAWRKTRLERSRECSQCGSRISIKAKKCNLCKMLEKEKKRAAWAFTRQERKELRTKPCSICGKEFDGPQRTYCSRECAATASRKEKIGRIEKQCEVCGKLFRIKINEKRAGRFCSQACSQKGQKKPVLFSCHRCGKEFIGPPSGLKKSTRVTVKHQDGPRKKFCSRLCSLAWQKETRKANQDTPKKKIYRKIASMIRRALKAGAVHKDFIRILGYSPDDLRNHLERKFAPGMGWHNYGPEWHLDHIIPLARLNYSTTEDPDFKRAWCLKNLQPLWATDNLKKSDRVESPVQPSLSFGACA